MKYYSKELLIELIKFYYFKIPIKIGKNFIVSKAYSLLANSELRYVVNIKNDFSKIAFNIPLFLPEDKFYYELIITGTIERGTIKFMKKFIHKDDCVFDVGANIGFFTLTMATANENVKVYAFEPLPSTFYRLRQNVIFNYHLKNITINNIAVTDKKDKIKINQFSGLHHGYSSISQLNRNDFTSFDVSSISIDEFISENEINKIDLIKIDVEGAEELVLKGALYTISKFSPSIILEMNEETAFKNNFKSSDLLNYLLSLHDYKFYRFPYASGEISPMSNVYDYKHGDNVIAISQRHLNRLEPIMLTLQKF